MNFVEVQNHGFMHTSLDLKFSAFCNIICHKKDGDGHVTMTTKCT